MSGLPEKAVCPCIYSHFLECDHHHISLQCLVKVNGGGFPLVVKVETMYVSLGTLEPGSNHDN